MKHPFVLTGAVLIIVTNNSWYPTAPHAFILEVQVRLQLLTTWKIAGWISRCSFQLAFPAWKFIPLWIKKWHLSMPSHWTKICFYIWWDSNSFACPISKLSPGLHTFNKAEKHDQHDEHTIILQVPQYKKENPDLRRLIRPNWLILLYRPQFSLFAIEVIGHETEKLCQDHNAYKQHFPVLSKFFEKIKE